MVKRIKSTSQYFMISRWWKGIRFTSSKICLFSPQMNKVPAPWRAAKIIIEVPSQIWYLTLSSKWIPSSLVIVIPLNIGKSRRAKQASASKPLRVAILKSLNCHLQDSSKHHSQITLYVLSLWYINISYRSKLETLLTYSFSLNVLSGVIFWKSLEMWA